MGDGRYYSWSQFFVVVFLTIFLILLSIGIVLSFYQDYHKNGFKIKIIHLFLGFGTLFRFIEEVLVSKEIGFFSKYLEHFSIIVCIWLTMGLFERRDIISYFFYIIFSFITGCFLVISLFNKEILINNYSFSTFNFGILYLVIVNLWFIFLISRLFAIKRKLGLFLIFMICFGFYITTFLMESLYKDLSTLIFYPAIFIFVNYFFEDLKAYRIGGDVFSNINDHINDSIIILDADDKIIYKNKHALESSFLNADVDQVIDGNPQNIINKSFFMKYKYNIETFFSISQDRYFDYRKKDIYKRSKLKGRSLIFSDITDYINMLDINAQQKERLEKINYKLNQYSNIVFDLEKRKEVSTLLRGIINSQEEFMEEFSKKIRDLSLLEDIESFDPSVDFIIDEAKANLAQIRQVVSRYRRFYGTRD